jgi:hypothetical protein
LCVRHRVARRHRSRQRRPDLKANAVVSGPVAASSRRVGHVRGRRRRRMLSVSEVSRLRECERPVPPTLGHAELGEGSRLTVAGHGGAPFQRTLNGASPPKVALPLTVPRARLNTLDVATYPAPWRHVPGREPTYGVKFK